MSEPPTIESTHDARELNRLRRLEALAELLPMIGRSLDVRQGFDRVSEVARRVLPHDAFALALLTEDRERVRIYAVSADAGFSPPEAIPLPAHEREFLLGEPWEFIILDDMLADERWKDLPPARAGYRSSLRVSIRLDDRDLLGGVNFMMLAALIDKSLVQREMAERYDLHELLSHYGHEKLVGLGEIEHTHERHLAWFLQFAVEAEAQLMGKEQASWFGKT